MTRNLSRNGKWAAIALLGLLMALCLFGLRFNSPTSDEQNHISRGYHYLVTGKLDLNVAPPFVNALSAVPLLFHRGITIPHYDLSHTKSYIVQFADEFVWVYNDAETIINSSRLMTILLSLVLGYFVFRWARDLWGPSGAVLALFLYVLDPNILAHSQLVTTDLGVAGMIFVATYFLWRFLRWRRVSDLLLAGLVLGLAQATKLSALLLLPIFAVIVLLEAFLLRDLSVPPAVGKRLSFSGERWPHALKFCCLLLLVLFALAFLSLWASYRFDAAPLSTPQARHATVDRLLPDGWLRQMGYFAIERIPIPFPMYLRGLLWLRDYAETGAPAFLMGQYSTKGWWYYFLIALAIKTPLPTLILLAGAVLLSIRRGCDRARREYVLYVPVVAYFLVTFFHFLNIGYRHILPVLPFCFVAAGKLAVWARERWSQAPRGGSRDVAALAALCLWCVIGSARIYPHYLAYFNELVGGPDNGYKYLVDSNLDWGQDLRNLKVYMQQNGLEHIHLGYFGSAHVDYYGIKADPLPMNKPEDLGKRPPAVYAISATYLQGGYLGNREAFSWLRSYQPFAKIGYSIFVYRLP